VCSIHRSFITAEEEGEQSLQFPLRSITAALIVTTVAGCTSTSLVKLSADRPFVDAVTEATKNAATNFISKSRVEGRVKTVTGPDGIQVTRLWTVTSEKHIDSFRDSMNGYCTALGGSSDIEQHLLLALARKEVMGCDKSGLPLYALILDSSDTSYSEAGPVITLHVTGYKAAEGQTGQEFLDAIKREREGH
jgi:hypothetical protein